MVKHWTVVLDDDPTGTQGLSDVPVIVRPSPDTFAWAYERSELVYVLTNTRALDETTTREVVTRAVHAAITAARRYEGEVRFISRGDSTLRGHFPLEVELLRDLVGVPQRGCLLVPAFPEAGRYTIDGIHQVNVRGVRRPVAETEYAQDATFGYTTSRLTDWARERVPADWNVVELPSRIFDEGVPALSRFLRAQDEFTVVCPSIRDHHDLERLAAAQRAAEADGVEYLVQSGPPYPRRLVELGPALPARPFVARTRGLIVVGSHTGTTTAQLGALAAGEDIVQVELDVPALLEDEAREVARAVDLARSAMRDHLVVLATSRKRISVSDRAQSLTIANTVGAALVTATKALLQEHPSFVIAKGGITSRDVVAESLGWDAANVIGPLVDSTLPVWESWQGGIDDTVCVIFPGNVGGPDLLARAVAQLNALVGPVHTRKGA